MESCDRRGAPHDPVQTWSLRLLDGWHLLRPPAGTVEVPTRERRLLSFLALRGGRPRSAVAGALWPDSPEHRAHGNLRAAVWHVQHRHPGLLHEDVGLLRLSPLVDVDVDDLRAVSHHLAAGAGTTWETGSLLRLLGHEDLLPGWSEPWVEEERTLLHQSRLRALEQLVEVLLRGADVEGALTVALRAVAIDPLRESAHRALIRVHLLEGNHVEALRVYWGFSERLRDDLGVTVSPLLDAMMRPLLLHADAGVPSRS
jgi:DNA-binding SARP family transcriptional activator